MAMPVSFGAITTKADAIETIELFIRNATDEEFDKCLSLLPQLNAQQKKMLGDLVAEIEPKLPLLTRAWSRAFELKWRT